MDLSTLYNIYSDAMASGKLDALKAFLIALKGHPFLAMFYSWLILRNLKKAVTEFTERFV